MLRVVGGVIAMVIGSTVGVVLLPLPLTETGTDARDDSLVRLTVRLVRRGRCGAGDFYRLNGNLNPDHFFISIFSFKKFEAFFFRFLKNKMDQMEDLGRMSCCVWSYHRRL